MKYLIFLANIKIVLENSKCANQRFFNKIFPALGKRMLSNSLAVLPKEGCLSLSHGTAKKKKDKIQPCSHFSKAHPIVILSVLLADKS